MTAIRIEGLIKKFGDTVAVSSVNLEIPSGSLFFLLGPSGCGKTTLLRMIAGFTEPTEGRIYFGDRNVARTPANERNTGMVFQNYALWPHMSVFENVAYPLRNAGVASGESKTDSAQAGKYSIRCRSAE
jgi:iron(III) transport system ATP-binding protein